MDLEFLLTLSTYIAFLASVWGIVLIPHLSRTVILCTTRLLLGWHAVVYAGLFFFDVSYTYAWLSMNEWAVWRRIFARGNYGIMHIIWILAITKAFMATKAKGEAIHKEDEAISKTHSDDRTDPGEA